MKPRVSCWRALRVRSSIRICEERLACKGSKPVSSYYCEDCDSNQCDLCEALLHEDERLSFHSRHPVVDAPEELVCDGGCPERNFADVSCSMCNAKFCYPCDRQTHSKHKKKTHIRRRFICSETEEFVSCEDAPLNTVESDNCGTSMLSMSCTLDGYSSANSSEDYHSSDNHLLKKDGKSVTQSSCRSFLLLNDKEQLQVTSEEFIKCLQCDSTKPLKVISIFGNTGDGKSYTLNHTFYEGEEVFNTSDAQSSCTIGVWAAYCKDLDVITIDTEGFLGQASNPNSRARMLLKVLAISDVIIYRTRAERLHNDMFAFLGDSSVAYSRHFSKELEEVSSKCNIDGPVSVLGPAVIIFHETHHTVPLPSDAEVTLRKRFHEMNLKLDSFSSLEYIGSRTKAPPTDFKSLKLSIQKHLKNSAVRTARSPDIIYSVLKILNDKFSNAIDGAQPSTFPDQYFTCPVHCLSCKCHCSKSMNHVKNDESHSSSTQCVYQYQYENRVFLCKVCYERGEKIVVSPKAVESNDSSLIGLAKYAWAGYLLECSKCGVIYRSRQYWFGNKDPWETCVRTETCHVWPDENDVNDTHTAQYIIDNLTSVTDVVQQLGSKPTRMLSSWVADQIAPSYWVPNSKVMNCGICGKLFDDLDRKHHCRMCGGGFCEKCSSQSLPVPGWGTDPVRVCDKCYETGCPENDIVPHPPEVTARKIGEVVQSTLGTVASAVNYPLGILKATARPNYWVPDHLITHCCVCEKAFSPKLSVHHCRSCGKGVCDDCSLARIAVPSKGWLHPVRVCDNCKTS